MTNQMGFTVVLARSRKKKSKGDIQRGFGKNNITSESAKVYYQ